jgi:DNA-binding NarL/FixJ family response regulator
VTTLVTVKRDVTHILDKLKVANRTQVVTRLNQSAALGLHDGELAAVM